MLLVSLSFLLSLPVQDVKVEGCSIGALCFIFFFSLTEQVFVRFFWFGVQASVIVSASVPNFLSICVGVCVRKGESEQGRLVCWGRIFV